MRPGTLLLKTRLFCEGIYEGDAIATALFQRITRDYD